MCSRFLSLAATALLLAPVAAQERTLRVCADPDNPPFSNERREGFDNEIAALIAKAVDAKLEFTWYSQRRFSLRNSVNAGLCDAVLGVPTSLDNVAVTRPYYRSSYVFVEQPGLGIHSMDDERLENLRIGLNIAGEDYTPPGHLLARRGLTANLKGFPIYGDPGSVVDAVRRKQVDVGIVWGPVAGGFAQGLDIAPVKPANELTVFDIAIGVRKGETALLNDLNRALTRECSAIRAVLLRHSVPLEGDTCSDALQPPPSASSR